MLGLVSGAWTGGVTFHQSDPEVIQKDKLCFLPMDQILSCEAKVATGTSHLKPKNMISQSKRRILS